uniref:LIM and calponin homology domains 1b n=1 Tax=Sphaeramia orbicularis TaxID=375764 RepID=A0A673A712_9TELE
MQTLSFSSSKGLCNYCPINPLSQHISLPEPFGRDDCSLCQHFSLCFALKPLCCSLVFLPLQAVTGRCFGDKDFRGGLENGILLCELLSSVKPGLVKKINRLPTPIAGLDNLSVFLRGCEELGLKGSQLFDPGDLQDTSTRPTAKGSDCSRKLKNVLITIYWLGRAANSCTSYNGPTLDLKEFEGLLSQMRKEAEEAESPKRSIRDSGYIDCWDSERSDSLSPPRHGREDSFDSLDSFGSRSRQTPSPDVLVTRGSSDGRGSDSESDGPPHRKMPDVRKDDMLARRTSVSEHRTAMPFNQYLPNKSNQSGYVPMPLRKKKSDKEEGGRKSWSTATSPIGGDRPFRFTHTDSVSDDPQSMSMIDMRGEEEAMLQPHSQVRHELMHNQYNRMKEDEDHWQDDLARWKNRRRSISQDLIKKEEERKMMEQLMSGDSCISQRRKSIKTYREIVEEKERREEELRDAYKRAKTPEEASAVLQRYAQRFSISEAVLERLQLPKLLDRSISADPSFPCSPFPLSLSLSASPTTPEPPPEMDPNGPMRYLRQHSAPAPKFTSTLEARIEEFPKDSSLHQRPQIRSRSSEPPSTRALSPKPVPLLTPKPYFQFRSPDSNKVRLMLMGSWLYLSSLPDREMWLINTFKVTCLPYLSTLHESSILTLAVNLSVFSEAKTEQEKTESSSQNVSSIIQTEISTQVTSQVRIPTTSKTKLLPPQITSQLIFLQCVNLSEKYRREQEKLKEEWEKAQREVAEEEKKYHEEERKILEETVTPLTPRSSALPSPSRGELSSTSEPQDRIVRSLADWERKQELLERQRNCLYLLFLSLCLLCRSVSGKKLCSSCGQPLGKGAAMIIETLSLYFHIQCFKCGVCKGQLGDTTTGTDVRIRNGLLNCHQCYIRSRCESPPLPLYLSPSLPLTYFISHPLPLCASNVSIHLEPKLIMTDRFLSAVS